MAYRIFSTTDGYGPRQGLEGPYRYPNGRVLYYDAQAGEYWDPRTDWFIPYEEIAELQNSMFDAIKG